MGAGYVPTPSHALARTGGILGPSDHSGSQIVCQELEIQSVDWNQHHLLAAVAIIPLCTRPRRQPTTLLLARG